MEGCLSFVYYQHSYTALTSNNTLLCSVVRVIACHRGRALYNNNHYTSILPAVLYNPLLIYPSPSLDDVQIVDLYYYIYDVHFRMNEY